MSEVVHTRSLDVTNSEKNAHYGKAGGMNKLRRVVCDEYEDGSVTLSFFSQKKDHPGQVLKFSAQDWRLYQNFIFPIVKEFEGMLCVEMVGPRIDPQFEVGLDVDSRPVLRMPSRDKSLRLDVRALVTWSLETQNYANN